MKNLFFLLLLLVTASCEINVMQPGDNGDTVVPDANARIARKLYVGGTNGKTIFSEEKYEYNQHGQLTKINRWNQNSKAEMELYYYEDFVYNDQDKLSQKRSFSRNQAGGFQQQWVTNYDYPASNQQIETQYYIDTNSKVLFPQNRIETVMEQGQKARVVQYYHTGKLFEKSRETVYRYEDGRLVAEQNLNSNGGTSTMLQYAYKGRTAKVEEFIVSRPESISEQSFQYDSRGRLIRSEVTKVNPIYCIAMVPNSATIYEYVD